jgi:hypothetical protein
MNFQHKFGLEIINKRTDFFILGLFFLVWSLNGYFIGGNTLKMGLLMIGFGLIIATSITLPKYLKLVNFSLISFSFLIAYWFIAIVRNQNTFTSSLIIFDIICFSLLLSGYLIGCNITFFKKVSPVIIVVIAILSIFGAVMFLKYQSQLVLNSLGGNSRAAVEDGDESGINVIGIAYTNAILFFLLYYFVVYHDLKKWVKGLLFLSLFSIFFVIMTTQSRGALIYIVLILILKNFKKLLSIKSFFNLLKMLIFSIIIFILTLNFFPVMQEKLDGTIRRFETLIEITENADADGSTNERALIIEDFMENIGEIILFGKEGYKPYPHNQFIEIIMRWGIIFGLPLVIFSLRTFFKSLIMLIKSAPIDPFIYLILFLFVFSFFQSLSSMSLEMNRMFWLGLGFISAIPNTRNLINKN